MLRIVAELYCVPRPPYEESRRRVEISDGSCAQSTQRRSGDADVERLTRGYGMGERRRARFRVPGPFDHPRVTVIARSAAAQHQKKPAPRRTKPWPGRYPGQT
jgi:hypothetical protein